MTNASTQDICYNPSFWKNGDDNTQYFANWAALILQYDFIKGTVTKELHYRIDDDENSVPCVEVYHAEFTPITDAVEQHCKFKSWLENNQFCKNWTKPWQLDHILKNSFFHIEEDAGVFTLEINSVFASVWYAAEHTGQPWEFTPHQKNFMLYHTNF